MTYRTRILVYGLLMLAEFSLVIIATVMNSALPLFLGFVPGLLIMQIQKRAPQR